jgi:acetolactate synthase-1/2/3 large subunit
LTQLVRTLGARCTNTLMGLGGYPATDKQFVGMLGMHGTYEANMAMQYCDVLLAVGARFDDRVIGNPGTSRSIARKIIHIDIDPSSISKRVKVDVPIVGNLPDVLDDILQADRWHQDRPDPEVAAEWWKQIDEWRRRDCLRYKQSDDIMPQFVIEKLYEVTGGDAFVTSDVGQHQMFAAQYYKFDKPRRWINSGGLGTMGVGLPYGMGVPWPIRMSPVACVTGEGSIQMCIQELSTCKQYGIPVKIMQPEQRLSGHGPSVAGNHPFGNRYSQSYMDSLPDFVKLAEAYGHVGMRIEKPGDVEPALARRPLPNTRMIWCSWISFDPTANVYPDGDAAARA